MGFKVGKRAGSSDTSLVGCFTVPLLPLGKHGCCSDAVLQLESPGGSHPGIVAHELVCVGQYSPRDSWVPFYEQPYKYVRMSTLKWILCGILSYSAPPPAHVLSAESLETVSLFSQRSSEPFRTLCILVRYDSGREFP